MAQQPPQRRSADPGGSPATTYMYYSGLHGRGDVLSPPAGDAIDRFLWIDAERGRENRPVDDEKVVQLVVPQPGIHHRSRRVLPHRAAAHLMCGNYANAQPFPG